MDKDFRVWNSRAAYKSIKVLRQDNIHHQSSPLLAEDGSVLTETSAKLQPWQQHYTIALCKPPPQLSDNLQHFGKNRTPDISICQDPPTITEIEDAIKKVPASKAPGTDGITGKILKAAADSVAPRLQQLCQLIWNPLVPIEWKERVILSFYKNKGDRRKTASYPSITLLSVPSIICMDSRW